MTKKSSVLIVVIVSVGIGIVSGVRTVTAVPIPNAIQWKAAPEPFVASLYQGVLGRAISSNADLQTVRSLAQLLANRRTNRYGLFWRFVSSQEYQASTWAKQ
jgi:hypothetical protein